MSSGIRPCSTTTPGVASSRAGLSDLLEVPELHPENAERVRNMASVLQRGPLADRLRWHDGRLASEDELAAVHDPAYIAMLREACEQGGRVFAPSTLVTGESWQPLLAAAGTAMSAGDAVISGGSRIAYALVRPPGHHAAPATADGYCFFNHVALVAERARAAGCERVAIIDWDVHHGNGTQACFYDRADVLTVSLHMRHGSWGPSHPQTGSAAEVGVERRGRPQRQRRAGTGRRHPRLRGGLHAGDPADPRPVPARPDRGRVRTGRQRL